MKLSDDSEVQELLQDAHRLNRLPRRFCIQFACITTENARLGGPYRLTRPHGKTRGNVSRRLIRESTNDVKGRQNQFLALLGMCPLRTQELEQLNMWLASWIPYGPLDKRRYFTVSLLRKGLLIVQVSYNKFRNPTLLSMRKDVILHAASSIMRP